MDCDIKKYLVKLLELAVRSEQVHYRGTPAMIYIVTNLSIFVSLFNETVWNFWVVPLFYSLPFKSKTTVSITFTSNEIVEFMNIVDVGCPKWDDWTITLTSYYKKTYFVMGLWFMAELKSYANLIPTTLIVIRWSYLINFFVSATFLSVLKKHLHK